MKKRRKRPIRVRKRWALNPGTRIKESGKIYRRAKEKKAVEKD